MKIWDYYIAKNWRPNTKEEWQWYLIRKINAGDLSDIDRTTLKKYYPLIKGKIDIGKKNLISYFLFGK